MSELEKHSDDEIAKEERRRHSIRMRFERAADFVRAATPDKKMTIYQARDACTYIAEALNLSRKEFSDAVLKHAGCSAYFSAD